MKATLCIIALFLLSPPPATAQQQGFQDPLLDLMAGNWVMAGTIGEADTTHDIAIEWVLGHQYLRFHEIAREKDSEGAPAYEAIVFIGWDESSRRYACLWLDITGGGGLSAQGIGHAEPDGDKLAFVFDTGDGSVIHTTFTYNRIVDTWHWLIDVDRDGKRSTFAQVALTRQ